MGFLSRAGAGGQGVVRRRGRERKKRGMGGKGRRQGTAALKTSSWVHLQRNDSDKYYRIKLPYYSNIRT